MKALLVLEDGMVFEGEGFGAKGEVYGEVVFNTAMTGYQEVLTDPSYKGQMVTMTYPLIGNYGINEEDSESAGISLTGFIIKEKSRIASNWRATRSLEDFLKEFNVLGIEGIDTRALTKHIRDKGEMRAVLSTRDADQKNLLRKVRASKGLKGVDLVKEVSCQEDYTWNQGDGEKRYEVVVLDCGVKYNILRMLNRAGCRVKVVSANSSAEDILSLSPDGVLISNGPGDPAAVPYIVETVRGLLGRVPIFGICFGHQLLGQALGGRTFKLKFGHHGGNHPVQDLKTGKVAITVQNHGFCVDMESLPQEDVQRTHINLNDRTLEGIRHKNLPVFSVQFHPESAPGPHDAEYLFGEFAKMMKGF